MNRLKLIVRAVLEFARQLWVVPRTAFRRNRGRAGTHVVELERLDRIRNPSKYLDKVNAVPPK